MTIPVIPVFIIVITATLYLYLFIGYLLRGMRFLASSISVTPFSCIRMDLRIHRICKEKDHQHRTDDHKFLFIEPVYQIIYHRSNGIYDCQTSDTKYQKPSAQILPFRFR